MLFSPALLFTDILTWKRCLHYCPFVRGILLWLVYSFTKGGSVKWKHFHVMVSCLLKITCISISYACPYSFHCEYMHRNYLIPPACFLFYQHIGTAKKWPPSAGDILKCSFINAKDTISIPISLKFVPKDPVNNKLAFVPIMAWRRAGDQPLHQPIMA